MNYPLIHSLLFSLLTALISLAGGWMAFRGLASLQQKRRIFFILCAAICLMIPPFLHAGVWHRILILGGWPTTSLMGGAFVLSLQLWPIPFLALVGAASQIHPSLMESAAIFLPASTTQRHILLPLLIPAGAVGFCLAFILALNHFIIPTTFQIPVQITQIYVMFSSLYDPGRALAESIPIWISSMILLVLTGWFFTTTPLRSARRLESPTHTTILSTLPGQKKWTLLLGILIGFSILPELFHLFLSSFQDSMISTIGANRPQLMASWSQAMGSAILASAAGILLAFLACRSTLVGIILSLVLITPWVVSGFFIGILMIQLQQIGGTSTLWMGTTLGMMVALAIRFVSLPFFTVWEALRRIPRESMEAARLFHLPSTTIFHRIIWPAIRFPALLATWVVYLLALWDVETILLIYPPGGETASLRVFQLLHYGYESQVSVLSLALIALALAPAIPFLFFAKPHFQPHD